MALGIAIACFILAALAFLIGFVTEYRQSRQAGPIAIVPTLPYAPAAALFLLLGLLLLPSSLSWWVYPTAFVGSALAFGYAIMNAAPNRGSH
jgi:hypothetical protein